MSRNPRLRDWPNCLGKLSVDELRRELSHWQTKIRFLGHPSARKEAAKRARDVERELAARMETTEE
jgi:hypothetical protein